MNVPSPPARVREIALADPVDALAALAGLAHPFLLHSPTLEARSRWSFFGAEPCAVFGPREYGAAIALWRQARNAPAAEVPAPFTGGLVGAWSYDFGRRLERLPDLARDDLAWPDVWLAAYDVVGAFDHETRRAWLVAREFPGGPDPGATERHLDALTRRMEAAGSGRAAAAPDRAGAVLARSTFTPEGYRRAVEAVREHIRRGDIFQANLSQRWSVPRSRAAAPGDVARELFAALASRSPAPFGGWLDLGDRAVASASPERFLEVRGRTVETRPIKGTRPRGTDPDGDARLAAALLASAKDRAENVMIVDVLRNDLGRVCETGSVRVPELCALESFAQVHHLTSTVTGTLRAGARGEAGSDAVDLLHACFPGGSITGAPKIRAMEIIEALEPVRRGLYTGAIGYLDWSGDADWNIAIRTATVTPGAIHFAAGGGITADSDPDAEFRETLAKAEGWRLAMAALGTPVELEPEPAAPGLGT